MKTNYKIIQVFNIEKNKVHVGCSKIFRNPIVCVGDNYCMNLNVDIKLTSEQIKQIEEQTRLELEDVISSGKLDSYIRDTVKSVIKSIVNEEIQTRGYRAHIAQKVTDTLMDREMGDYV